MVVFDVLARNNFRKINKPSPQRGKNTNVMLKKRIKFDNSHLEIYLPTYFTSNDNSGGNGRIKFVVYGLMNEAIQN